MAFTHDEIVVSPYVAYLAPEGTTFPAVDDAEGDLDVAWTRVGTNGSKNYANGVTLNLSQTTQTFVPSGGTSPMKVWRTDESATFSFTVADLSADQFALMLGGITVTTVAASSGIAGEKHFEGYRGPQMHLLSLLLRGASPENNLLTGQIEVPACYQTGNPQPVFDKAGPAELAVEFTPVEANEGQLYTIRWQTAAAL